MAPKALTHLHNTQPQDVFFLFIVEFLLILDRVDLNDCTAPNMHVIDEKGRLVFVQRKHVHVVKHRHNGRFQPETFHQIILSLYLLRLFKTHLFSKHLHSFEQQFAHLGAVSLQNLLDIGDVPVVFLRQLHPHTWRLTTLDMVLQADFVFARSDSLGCQCMFTITNRIKLFDQV